MELYKRALLESKKIKLGKKIFIIGNLHTFPVAVYGAAKFYEILGTDVHYERIEQFLHMGIFSAKPGDTVIIFEEKNYQKECYFITAKKLRNASSNMIY